MMETQYHGLIDHIKKVKHPSKGVQEAFEATKVIPGIASNNLNKLLRIKHRRKYKPQQEKKVGVPSWKNKYMNMPSLQERFSYKGYNSQYQQSEKNTIRSPQNLCSSERQKPNFSRISTFAKSSASKLKYPLRKQQNDDKQSSKIQKLAIRLEQKFTQIKNKTTYKEPPQNRFKKVAIIVNKTTSHQNSYFQEEPFVDLISKYRFQNLKTYEEPSLQFKKKFQNIDFTKTSKKKSRDCFFRSVQNGSKEEYRNSTKQKKKMSHTMTKMECKRDQTKQKIRRRISILSPWQNDQNQMGNTNQLI